MKIAIGLITTIFGVLLVMYGIINNAAYIIVGPPPGMMLAPNPEPSFLFGAILIMAGCVVFERGIEKNKR